MDVKLGWFVSSVFNAKAVRVATTNMKPDGVLLCQSSLKSSIACDRESAVASREGMNQIPISRCQCRDCRIVSLD